MEVFLRMLEYYNGILFLTTNRGGVLDEAVKSRVHLNLKYESLNLHQTKKIFELNIERLEEIEEQRSKAKGHKKLIVAKGDVLKFAEDHFNKYENSNGIGRWNGRQIRNAFLIASSLAHFEGESQPELQKQLRSSHFNLVDETTMLYDQFRLNATGKSDDASAYERMERDAPMPPPVRRPSTQVPLGQGQNLQRAQEYSTQQAPAPGNYINTAPSFQGGQRYANQQPPAQTSHTNTAPNFQGGQGYARVPGAHGGFQNSQPNQYGGTGDIPNPHQDEYVRRVQTPVQAIANAPSQQGEYGPTSNASSHVNQQAMDPRANPNSMYDYSNVQGSHGRYFGDGSVGGDGGGGGQR